MVNGKIPVNIITGFLGSGKTSAIIKLLKNKATEDQWAVIINEFGKVSIDSQTLSSTSDAGDIYEVSGGCICCSAKGYFQENLEQIIGSGSYSRIIIEPSGLGGVDMISDIVLAMSNLSLLRIICLVDIFGIDLEKLQRLPIYRNQILKAEVVVFTKCDLLVEKTTENRLVEKFQSLYPGKQCFRNNEDDFYWHALLDAEDTIPASGNKFRMARTEDNQLTDANYQSINYLFNSETIFSTEKLIAILQNHPSIFRAKGHMLTNQGWMLLNFTLSGYLFEPCAKKIQNELVVITERSRLNPEDNPKLELISAII